MPAKSTFLENALLNHVLRGNTGGTAYSQPATLYVALYTTNATAAGPGTEVSGGSYARQAVTFNAPANGSAASAANVTFPIASAPWGTVVSIGICDALTGGNMLYYGSLSVSKTIGTGDDFIVNAGNLTLGEQ